MFIYRFFYKLYKYICKLRDQFSFYCILYKGPALFIFSVKRSDVQINTPFLKAFCVKILAESFDSIENV